MSRNTMKVLRGVPPYKLYEDHDGEIKIFVSRKVAREKLQRVKITREEATKIAGLPRSNFVERIQQLIEVVSALDHLTITRIENANSRNNTSSKSTNLAWSFCGCWRINFSRYSSYCVFLVDEMTTLLDIIKSGLIANGYDGLYCSGRCACTVDDLAPCGCGPAAQGYVKCEPGHKHTHSVTGEWVIAKQKEPLSDDEIQKTIDEIG